MRKGVRIAASILAADFARLGDEVARVEPHLDMLHVDVMDGHFVPNISLGVPVISSLRRVSGLAFDCHLMVTDPDRLVEPLRKAGATGITVHLEAVPDPRLVEHRARQAGLGFGLVINPGTPYEALDPFLERCDMVLVMSVEPGFGGQEFLPTVLAKVEAARRAIDRRGLDVDLEIDGGIGPKTIGAARRAGADVFVAGTAIFGQPDPVMAIAGLRSAASEGGA
ncbi:MAG: ribulose-phosphate 3-epimerase [Acidimicrobiia bacterium]|nr:ribulose-phosphate 3-epimerase [Acidimicrobiia bacterium]